MFQIIRYKLVTRKTCICIPLTHGTQKETIMTCLDRLLKVEKWKPLKYVSCEVFYGFTYTRVGSNTYITVEVHLQSDKAISRTKNSFEAWANVRRYRTRYTNQHETNLTRRLSMRVYSTFVFY